MSAASSEVAYLSRALKAPRIRETAASLAKRAREEGWDYEAYLAAVLSAEVTSRESHGGENRVRFAHFPQVKTLDDFDFAFQRSVKRDEVMHLAQLDFLREKKNVIFLGPPGTGKTHFGYCLSRAGGPAGIPGALRHRSGVGDPFGQG
jgi:DNA replication protein DnaC